MMRNRKAGPSWISLLANRCVRFTLTSVYRLPKLLFCCKSQPIFLIARFLIKVLLRCRGVNEGSQMYVKCVILCVSGVGHTL